MDHPADEFRKWVGYCITAWAGLEEELFDLCWRALASGKAQAAIVYFRTPGLEPRLTLVDELVCSRLPKPERKSGGHSHPDVDAWKELLIAIRAQLSIRRQIAHHPVREVDNLVDLMANENFPQTNTLTLSWLEIYMSGNEELREKGSASPLRQPELAVHYNGVI
jgi:hypothetical protein